MSSFWLSFFTFAVFDLVALEMKGGILNKENASAR
jgi:hypothetical protein